eukprot:scaffold29419_cov47-Tisochrysis_lutea.AAC.3
MQPNQVILSVHALKRPLLAYVRMHVALAAVIAHASFQALVTGRHEGKVCTPGTYDRSPVQIQHLRSGQTLWPATP